MITRTSRLAGIVAATAALTLSGCSIGSSPDGAAKDLIEGQLATDLNLGTVSATCEEPPNSDTGTTFGCTSTSDFGEIKWTATMTDSKTVTVDSVNLVRADVLPQVEEAAAGALGDQIGVPLDATAVDCGADPVVLADDLSMLCALTDPDTGDVYDTTLTFTDIDTGNFDISVAPTPRA